MKKQNLYRRFNLMIGHIMLPGYVGSNRRSENLVKSVDLTTLGSERNRIVIFRKKPALPARAQN